MNTKIDRVKFLMSYDNKTSLNENYNNFEQVSSPVITDWLSPDENFLILFDELYDLKNKSRIGNIWENFDNFKLFLKHSFEVSNNVPQHIKESVLNTLSKSLLIESKTNFTSLKPIFREFLTERTWSEWGQETAQDFGSWMYKKGSEAVKNISDFASTSYEGAKKLVGNISRGEWNEVLNLLGKGAKYVIRRLRDAMYHPVGLILDAVLVATGIGKSVQWIPWALIVALDVYEIYSGDYEQEAYKDVNPEYIKFYQYFQLGFDILGLVFTGAVGKAAKALFGGARSADDVARLIANNPAARETLEQMAQGAGRAPGLLSRAADWLSSKFPAGSKFIQGVLGFVESIISGFVDTIKKLLSPKALGTVATHAPILYGLDKGAEYISGGEEEKGEEMASTDELSQEDIDLITKSGQATYTL